MSGIQRVSAGRSKGISMLVYGDPGVGKTRLASESGGKVLILRPPIDHTDSIDAEKTTDEWIMRTWKDMFEARDFARSAKGAAYDWIWLDSLSLFQYIGLDDIWDVTVTEKPHRAKHGLDKGEYGINMTRIGQWMRDMISEAASGAFNFGCTCTVREAPPTEDESESALKKMPWVQGKNMPAVTAGYFNVVAFLEQDSKGERRLHLKDSPDYVAKDQFNSTTTGLLKGADVDTIFRRIEAARKARPATANKAGRSTAARRRKTTTTRARKA